MKPSFYVYFHKGCSGAAQMLIAFQKNTKSMIFTNLLDGNHLWNCYFSGEFQRTDSDWVFPDVAWFWSAASLRWPGSPCSDRILTNRTASLSVAAFFPFWPDFDRRHCFLTAFFQFGPPGGTKLTYFNRAKMATKRFQPQKFNFNPLRSIFAKAGIKDLGTFCDKSWAYK